MEISREVASVLLALIKQATFKLDVAPAIIAFKEKLTEGLQDGTGNG
jgi:hypothetical protein